MTERSPPGNQTAERLFRCTADEVIGNDIHIIIPPTAAQSGRLSWSERIDVSISMYPVKNTAGKIVGMAAVARDITAEKFAEEKFRLAVESCPSGMIMTDHAGRILMVNSEVARMFGYRREELIGELVDILVPGRSRKTHSEQRSAYSSCARSTPGTTRHSLPIHNPAA